MIIGVCGKSGSGKTYFSDLLSKVTNWEVIHVDDLVHEILETEEFINALIQKYGSTFVEEGKVNRKQLGAYLFSNIDIMESYNRFIWPWIEEKIDAKIQEKNYNLILDWMQLPLTKYFPLCDRKILLKSEKEYRKKRVFSRDHISKEYFESRESCMLDYRESDFDDIIYNENQDLLPLALDIVQKVNSLTVGFYAGSFDPFTNGHLEIIRKASILFDRLIVGIGKNPKKERYYPEEEMKRIITYTLKREGIASTVLIYSGLTLEIAQKYHCNYLIRGLRDQTDYTYEEDIATYNEQKGGIDTIYLRAGKLGNISSTLVRKKLEMQENVESFVPEAVYQYLMKKRSNY